MNIGAAEIRNWHTSPPRNWHDIGYHRVIRRSGVIEPGRPLEIPGAHALGYNKHSIGVCLVGGMAELRDEPECNFTRVQWLSLFDVLNTFKKDYPGARVIGHNAVSDRACPTFNVSALEAP